MKKTKMATINKLTVLYMSLTQDTTWVLNINDAMKLPHFSFSSVNSINLPEILSGDYIFK